jgi:hypothetical protein
VTAEPVPGMCLYGEEREIADRVDGCLPYLLALARIEAPSELLPNLGAGNLHVVREGFAPARGSRGRQEHSGRSSGSRSVDWAALEETRRLYGRRGEEAAYQAERNRLIAAGGNPERVHWVSRDIETADHDLESVGEDGKPIYIDVKTTSPDYS